MLHAQWRSEAARRTGKHEEYTDGHTVQVGAALLEYVVSKFGNGRHRALNVAEPVQHVGDWTTRAKPK